MLYHQAGTPNRAQLRAEQNLAEHQLRISPQQADEPLTMGRRESVAVCRQCPCEAQHLVTTRAGRAARTNVRELGGA
eukprot:4717459-Alexandrium_andersonii.AAC.1